METIEISNRTDLINGKELVQTQGESVHVVFGSTLGDTTIDSASYAELPNLVMVTFKGHVKKIGSSAFYHCGIKAVRFEKGFDLLEEHSFAINPLSEIQIVARKDDHYNWKIEKNAFYNSGVPGEQLLFRVEGQCEAIRGYAQRYGYLYTSNKNKPIEIIDQLTNERQPIISAENLTVSFQMGEIFHKRKKDILSNIDISIRDREMIMIIGGSGCGKSTLIKQLFGLERCAEKNTVSVSINKQSATGVATSRRIQKMLCGQIYYAPQFTISNENLTVEQEIQKNALMFRGAKYSKGELEKITKAHHLYDETSTLLNTKVGKISGGQKKKLLLACSEAIKPQIYIFDEPDSGLDEPSAYNMYIKQLRKDQVDEQGKTVIVVSHHPRRIMMNFTTNENIPFEEIFTRIIVLAKCRNLTNDNTQNKCGTVVFDGTPQKAREFFELDTGDPYSRIVSKVMTREEGGEATQKQIDMLFEKYQKIRRE